MHLVYKYDIVEEGNCAFSGEEVTGRMKLGISVNKEEKEDKYEKRN